MACLDSSFWNNHPKWGWKKKQPSGKIQSVFSVLFYTNKWINLCFDSNRFSSNKIRLSTSCVLKSSKCRLEIKE